MVKRYSPEQRGPPLVRTGDHENVEELGKFDADAGANSQSDSLPRYSRVHRVS